MTKKLSSDDYENLVANIAMSLTTTPSLISDGKINHGRDNKWLGVSKQEHQIDVSISSQNHLILIECKKWKERIKIENFLTLYGRIIDIAKHPENTHKKVTGILVTTSGFQPGVFKLREYYKDTCSAYVINEESEIIEIYHSHIVKVDGSDHNSFGNSAIHQSPPSEHTTDCQSLEEIRANIDRLDREIVRLIAERGLYVTQAARFKKNTAQVQASQRVQQVIDKVRQLAEEAGVSPDLVEQVYRTMIAAFIQAELKAHEENKT